MEKESTTRIHTILIYYLLNGGVHAFFKWYFVANNLPYVELKIYLLQKWMLIKIFFREKLTVRRLHWLI